MNESYPSWSHLIYASRIKRDQRLLRRTRQARRWLRELRRVRALAAERDIRYRIEIGRLRMLLSDAPTHTDLDAAAFEVNRLRAELARHDADATELRRQLQAALENQQLMAATILKVERANG